MEKQWYYGFQQTVPSPSRGTAVGPFDTYSAAMRHLQNSHAPDCQLYSPFQASSKEQADTIARKNISDMSDEAE